MCVRACLHMCAPQECLEPTKVGMPRIRVTDGCELLCEYWELNLSPLQEQKVLLTTGPPLQPGKWDLSNLSIESENVQVTFSLPVWL